MDILEEVVKMKKEVEKLNTMYLEQLHYEKMQSQKWKYISLGLVLLFLICNICWIIVWNAYDYEEIITTDEIIETTSEIEQDGSYNIINGVDIYGAKNKSNNY